MNEIDAIYNRVAAAFAARVHSIFASEETLKAFYHIRALHLSFDRTDGWNVLLGRELMDVWTQHGLPVKAPLTTHDERQILKVLANILDFNLFTQVLLNLQSWESIRYRAGDAEAKTAELREKWASRNPSVFDAKPKMFKVAAAELEVEYNVDLSTLKALKIIAAQTLSRSFRVSPIGSTPALADSRNLSMLGVGGDEFLEIPEGFHAYYYTWDQIPYELVQEFNALRYPGIDYAFHSKSGGEILNDVLFVRRLTAFLFRSFGPEAVFLPRMTSVLMVSQADPSEVQEHAALCSQRIIPGLIRIHEGRRQERVPM